MKRHIKLEKYIKRYTDRDIKVYIVKWLWGGYGAWINSKKGILKIREDDSNFKPLIWHEMGHLMAGAKSWVKNEVEAQKWALKTLKKLKYKRIYKESINWIQRWGNSSESANGYKKARKILLQ